MSVQNEKEVDLFRAISIRDIEERDMLYGTSDPALKMAIKLDNRVPGHFDSWCPPKDYSPPK